ncbi:MAG TPA: hypothetical protein VMV03_08775 [Spirochaetia bacterium]|nr:hypothetical protein [Spirochaetia bacterium]
MGRALAVMGIAASALLLLSCQKKPAPPALQAAVADDHSAFAVIDDLPFWLLSGDTPVQKGTVQIGEKLTLLGQSRRVMLAGREREVVPVRRDSGAEGWVRSDLVVSRSILAVVTSDGAVIYSVPRNTAATTAIIPRMTVLVIHADSAGMPFIRITGYDPGTQDLYRGVWLRNEGVSARPDDVQTAILLKLAAVSTSARQKEAFLTSALKDYPGSLFLPQVQAALDAMHAPPAPPPQPPSPPPADQAAPGPQPAAGAQPAPAPASAGSAAPQ